jgi:hypothetical protein
MSSGASRKARSRPARPSGLFKYLQKKNNMDIFAAFATDSKLENEGKWFPLSKTARVLVARSGNEKYTEMLRAKLKEAQLDGMPEKEANAVAEELVIDVLATTVLLKWEGLTYQGKPAPVSVEMAKVFLTVKDFRKKISGFADNFDAFRVQEEVEQGNA